MSTKCEDCGAADARLICKYPAWLCLGCATGRRDAALPETDTEPIEDRPPADSVECQVSGGQANYRFPRGSVTTQFEFIGLRPGVTGVGELIQISDLVTTIRDSLAPPNSFHGYAQLFVLDPGSVRPIDVVTTDKTSWISIGFDPDEWMWNWSMMHDLESREISDEAFQELYEISRAEGKLIRDSLQDDSEVAS